MKSFQVEKEKTMGGIEKVLEVLEPSCFNMDIYDKESMPLS
jgi:hypothetical protein